MNKYKLNVNDDFEEDDHIDYHIFWTQNYFQFFDKKEKERKMSEQDIVISDKESIKNSLIMFTIGAVVLATSFMFIINSIN